jgi:PAS domain S-box-containing protein
MLRFSSVMSKRILILIVLVTVVFVGKTFFDITSDRKQVIISAERLSRGFATALNGHAIHTFSNAENTLDDLIRRLPIRPDHGLSDECHLHQFLGSYKRKCPFSPFLFVATGSGRLLAISSEFPVRTVDLAGREFFQHHLKSRDTGVFISRPLASWTTGNLLIFLTKRISNPDGSLGMIVGIAVDPLYFSDFYRSIELGKHDRIFLFRRDGAILTLEPFHEQFMGKVIPSSDAIRKELAKNPHAGTIHLDHGVVDQTSRIISYRFSSRYPVVCVVSLGEDDVLARWRKRSIKSAAGALLLVVLVGTLGLLVYRQVKRLKQSEDKYSLIATTANEGIWMLDAHDRITYLNPRVGDMFGYRAEEMIGQPISAFMCPDELGDHESRMNYRRQGGSERYERRFLSKDGTDVWTVISAAALIDDEDGYQGVVAMCLDVSDRKRSEERQARLEEQLRQAHKMEAVGILAGGMAHDFNNLLQSIMGYIFLAKMSVEAGSEAHEYLDEAEKVSGQASELGQRLLLLSRGGVAMLRAAPLPPLILPLVSSTLEGTAITGEFDLPADMPHVIMDESLMKQVISHLTINAVETMPDGGTLRIRGTTLAISAQHGLPLPAGRYVHIAFIDTGAGIPADNLPKIFDPYFTTKGTWNKKGMGLGLALCHTIIRKHGGMISATSTVGEGATFNIYLPVAGEDSPVSPPVHSQLF